MIYSGRQNFMYHVDAFGNGIFSGNPACVCVMSSWPEEKLMQQIAMENNLAETAFVVSLTNGFHIRWFTPTSEVKLCGHATLATAFVLKNFYYPEDVRFTFQSLSGELVVYCRSDDSYMLDFPTDFPKYNLDLDYKIRMDFPALPIIETCFGDTDILIQLKNQTDILDLKLESTVLKKHDVRGFIFTAPGQDCDFVSRCFYPAFGIDEDPATGSAHTLLTPFWAKRLRKNAMKALQLSSRVGYFDCVLKGKRTALVGKGYLFKKSILEDSLGEAISFLE